MRGRDLDGLLEASALEDVEPAHHFLGLGEGAVGDHRLPVADSDGSRPSRWRHLVAHDPDTARLKVVQPGKALLLAGVGRVGLSLGVHLLRVPADQQQESHRRSSRRYFRLSVERRTSRAEIDISLGSGVGYDELHQGPAVTVLVVWFVFLNRTEACFEPAPDGSLIPQVRIESYPFASCVCDQVLREGAGGIRSERTTPGRGDQEHVEAAHVDYVPKPSL